MDNIITVKIAGKIIEISPLYDYIADYCKSYITDGIPDFKVRITQSDIEFERAKSAAEDRKEGIPVRHFTDEYLETLAVYRKIAEQMLSYDTSNPASALKTMELIDRLMESVQIYRLYCNMESEAAKVAYEGMQG